VDAWEVVTIVFELLSKTLASLMTAVVAAVAVDAVVAVVAVVAAAGMVVPVAVAVEVSVFAVVVVIAVVVVFPVAAALRRLLLKLAIVWHLLELALRSVRSALVKATAQEPQPLLKRRRFARLRMVRPLEEEHLPRSLSLAKRWQWQQHLCLLSEDWCRAGPLQKGPAPEYLHMPE